MSIARAAAAETRFHYNDVYRMATHNSYWVKRDNVVELFATGTQERLLDQLLFDRARALEIDIHKDPGASGQWNVFHTDKPSNSFCSPFTECLKQLEQFQYALPRHEVVTVVLELKEILGYNFDGTHRPADLDALIEKRLGPFLYRPRDFLARCRAGATMRECAAEQGWPTIDELRGKFIFAVLGNWRFCTVGHGGSGWATYATDQGGVARRSGFPMLSDFSDLTHESCGTEYVPREELQAATEASVIEQVENVTDAAHLKDVAGFIRAGGVVRGHDAWTLPEQQARVDQGFHMLQTDYPWVQLGDRGFTRPFRALDPALADSPALEEPGGRIGFFKATGGPAIAFASQTVTGELSDWETLPSTTRPSPNAALANSHWTRGKGCLRVRGGADEFAVCRQTVDGHWWKAKPHGEDAAVTVESSHGGRRGRWQAAYSDSNTSRGSGDQLRLTVVADGHGGSCVTAYTAAEIAPWGAPAWKALATDCFGSPLETQGVSAQWGDVVFFRTLHDGREVAASELAADTAGTGYRLVDLDRP